MCDPLLKAEENLFKKGLDKEYLGIVGLNTYVNQAIRLAYGENSKAIKEKRVRWNLTSLVTHDSRCLERRFLPLNLFPVLVLYELVVNSCESSSLEQRPYTFQTQLGAIMLLFSTTRVLRLLNTDTMITRTLPWTLTDLLKT
jgi:hypothetical protein